MSDDKYTDVKKAVIALGSPLGSIIGMAAEQPLVAPLFGTFAALIAYQLGMGTTTKINKAIQFIKDLKAQVEQLDEDKINKDFTETEEWSDLLREAYESALKSRDDERFDWYIKILIGALKADQNPEDSPEDYINILSSLTPNQVKTLSRIWQTQQVFTQERLESPPYPQEIREYWLKSNNRHPPSLDLIFRRLESLGLINVQLREQDHYAAGIPLITTNLRRIMSFIQGVEFKENQKARDKPSVFLEEMFHMRANQPQELIWRDDLFNALEKHHFSKEDFSSAASILENKNYLTFNKVMALDAYQRIQHIKFTGPGFDDVGKSLRHDWHDLERLIARSICNGLKKSSEISDSTNISIGIVTHFLRQMESNYGLRLSDRAIEIEVIYTPPAPIRHLAESI